MIRKYILSIIFSIMAFSFINAQTKITAIGGDQGCAPFTTSFSVSGNTGTVFYTWNFGDGTGSFTGTTINHTFMNSGQYNVGVTARSVTGAPVGSDDIEIEVIGAPKSINLSNDSVCPNDAVSMYISNEGQLWQWDFGDGTTFTENSSNGSASHAYSSPGIYPISVDVTNDCGTFTIDTLITVSTSLGFSTTPSFNYPDTTCINTPLRMSTQDIYSAYDWNFGDGNSSNGNETDHAYLSVGDYPISLKVTNGCGNSTTVQNLIHIGNSVPISDESIEGIDSVCPGQEFNVQATSNNGTTYSWDFGDGKPAVDGENINYTYDNIGTYNVNLTIKNNCGNSKIVPTQIVVTNSAPFNNATLELSSNKICPGGKIEFNLDDQYEFYIDFGDGTGSNKSKNHIYPNLGTYPTSVTYKNACGNILKLYDTVFVENNLQFTGNPRVDMEQNTVCINSEAAFFAESGYASYYWNFGDGGTSTNQDAKHIYNSPGTYNVTVDITNGCGANAIFNVTANITNNLPVTDLEYEILGDSVCPNDPLLFTGEESSGLDYSWDFGDGNTSKSTNTTHNYVNPGTYFVSISAFNGCGNGKIIKDTVVVNSNVYPSEDNVQIFHEEEGCIGDDIFFAILTGSGSYTWEFGDGNSTSQTNPIRSPQGLIYDVAQHSYSSTGAYNVYFSVTNGCGNTYKDTLQVDIGNIGDDIESDVNFWWNELEASCQGEPIEFVGNGASTYSWDFGDGSGTLVTQGSLKSVYHTYTNSGNYDIVVTGRNQCGKSSSKTEEIFIPQSLINLTTNSVESANCGEADGVAVVSAIGGMPPYQYEWSNGDNSLIADSLTSGLYVITVTDNNDCSAEGIVTVSDNQGPTIVVDNIGHLNCYGQSNGYISVTLLGGAPPYDIIWSNGDRTEDIFNLVAGPYEIFVKDANGCAAIKSILITQPKESVISVIAQPANCGGNNGTARAVISNGNAPYNYIWPNISGSSSQTTGLTPGIYDLLVVDSNTCLLEKEFVINEKDGPIILLDSIVTGNCSNNLSSIYVSTIGGTGPFTYEWSNGNTSEDLIGVLPADYNLRITGNNGCKSFMSETVEIALPSENPICVVTVDTFIGGNIVVWERVKTSGIDFYNIYKESSQSGLYYLIGVTDADSSRFFHDVNSDPTIRSWRYKISAVDDCGNESVLSDEHKTIHLTANLGVGKVVNLIWDDYEGINYSTYKINRYHPTTGWKVIDSVASNLNSYTDITPPSDENLIYTISIDLPNVCSPDKGVDRNLSRSNRGSINVPDNGGTVSINEYSKNEIVRLFPNPTNGEFTLHFEKKLIGAKVELFDVQGKLLNSLDIAHDENTKRMSLTAYDSGIYLIKVSSSKNVEYIKVIKE